MIDVQCEGCQRMLQIPDECIGQQGKCNHCGSRIQVYLATFGKKKGPVRQDTGFVAYRDGLIHFEMGQPSSGFMIAFFFVFGAFTLGGILFKPDRTVALSNTYVLITLSIFVSIWLGGTIGGALWSARFNQKRSIAQEAWNVAFVDRDPQKLWMQVKNEDNTHIKVIPWSKITYALLDDTCGILTITLDSRLMPISQRPLGKRGKADFNISLEVTSNQYDETRKLAQFTNRHTVSKETP